MNKTLILGLIILAIVAGGIFFSKNKPGSEAGSDSNIPTPVVAVSVVPSIADNSDLKAGGSSFLDSKGVFSVLYPSDYALDTQDSEHPRIYKRGDEQRPQSEMSDGVLVVFESIDLKGKSLESLVDTRIEESTQHSQITQPKKATTLNGYSGFSYQAEGLGSSTNLFLQKNVGSNYAVVITYLVADPKQKNYQAEVESILSTLELLK